MLKIIVNITNFGLWLHCQQDRWYCEHKHTHYASETMLSTGYSTRHTHTYITQLCSVPRQSFGPRAYQFSSLHQVCIIDSIILNTVKQNANREIKETDTFQRPRHHFLLLLKDTHINWQTFYCEMLKVMVLDCTHTNFHVCICYIKDVNTKSKPQVE